MRATRCTGGRIKHPVTTNCVECESIKLPEKMRTAETRTTRDLLVKWSKTLKLDTDGLTTKQLCAQLLELVARTGVEFDVLLADAQRRQRILATDPQEIAAVKRAAEALEAARQVALQQAANDPATLRVLEEALKSVKISVPTVPEETVQRAREAPVATPVVLGKLQARGTYENKIMPDLKVVIDANGATISYRGQQVNITSPVAKLWNLASGAYLLRLANGIYRYAGITHVKDKGSYVQTYNFEMAPGDDKVISKTNEGALVSNNNVYLPEFGKRMTKADWADFEPFYVRNYANAKPTIINALANARGI